MTALHRRSLSALAAGLRERSWTSIDIVEACLARIDAREDTVHAWQHLDRDAALEQARRCDRSDANSPLHGIPVGLKDVIDTAEAPTTYGSPIYEGHRPAADAICAQRLRAAGAVLLGKTVTTQFAHRTPGKTANPRNAAHTPGGSSSGSAAAVADSMVPLAFGTQTAGSVIRPAAYCGTIGFKPSYGWTDFSGVKHLAASLDTLGYYVRSLDDIPLVHAVLGNDGLTEPDEASAAPPSLALCRTPVWQESAPPARSVLEETANRLADAGAPVRELDLGESFASVFDAHTTIMEYEMARHLDHERQNHCDLISPPTQMFINAGLDCSEEKYAQARYTLDRARSDLRGLIGNDIILTPSAPGEAPPGLESTGDAVFNRMWTSLHVPCLHLPIDLGPQGLPVGVTLVGRIGGERPLVATARWIATRLELPLFG